MASPHFEPAAIDFYPSRQAWDAASFEILHTMLDRWSLSPGAVFAGGYSATVIAVTDANGSPAVLKIAFPHHEALAEAVALEAFPLGTAPRVLRLDPWTWTMLLERVEPGTPLGQHPLSVDEAIDSGANLLALVHSSPIPEGVPTLAEAVHGFVRRAPMDSAGLRFPRAARFVKEAFDDAERLTRSQFGPPVLIHGDFNPGNILLSTDGWVAIDPKPMVGDGAWDLWPLVSQLGGEGAATRDPLELARRMRRAAALARVDAARAIRWARVRAALTICWYLDEQDSRRAEGEIAGLEAWNSVCGTLDS